MWISITSQLHNINRMNLFSRSISYTYLKKNNVCETLIREIFATTSKSIYISPFFLIFAPGHVIFSLVTCTLCPSKWGMSISNPFKASIRLIVTLVYKSSPRLSNILCLMKHKSIHFHRGTTYLRNQKSLVSHTFFERPLIPGRKREKPSKSK